MHGFACASAENMTELYTDLQGQCPGRTAEDLRCHQGHLQFLDGASSQVLNPTNEHWKILEASKSSQKYPLVI
jgi:hypothetical protein